METTRSTTQKALPPGQRAIGWFPRIGKDLSAPPPAVPEHPMIAIAGPTIGSFDFDVAALADLPRRTLTADFHCVAGFTVRDVHWGGVGFADFYRSVIEPALGSEAEVTHLCFGGLDGVRAMVELADALAEDVLIADTLDGEALDGAHGAPIRIVSPNQYGYMSLKHLCRIDVRTSAPAKRGKMPLLDRLLEAHPRARVWEEERHGSAPSWLVRPLYRAVKGVMLFTAARKARRLGASGGVRRGHWQPGHNGQVIEVEPERFEEMVSTALDSLPEELGKVMRNVAVTVQHEPGPPNLLGLYRGVPLTSRTNNYVGVLPDRITIYHQMICRICSTEEQVVDQVRRTVIHEIGHHFGISDDRLHELGW